MDPNTPVVRSKDDPRCHEVVRLALFAAADPSCLNCARFDCPKDTVLAAAKCGFGLNCGVDKLCAAYWPNFDKMKEE